MKYPPQGDFRVVRLKLVKKMILSHSRLKLIRVFVKGYYAIAKEHCDGAMVTGERKPLHGTKVSPSYTELIVS